MPELKLYTVAEIRDWLENNRPAEGLSERVIAPTRAWAIIHNPYVKDEDTIVAAIFEDGELAAFTASFPDMLDGQRVWWCSTLYCYPQYAGRGYGMIVVGSLMEAHEPDLTYDRWGAQETVEIFKTLGLQTTYTKRYHLSNMKIDGSSIKGKLAYCAQVLKKCIHPWPKQIKGNYTLRYATYIDGETYAFMKAHKGHDLWLREQNMLNWILRYPFIQTSPLMKKVEKDNEFSSNVSAYSYLTVNVYIEKTQVGVYVLRVGERSISVVYLYYAEESTNVVFDSIINHIIQLKARCFTTDNEELSMHVSKKLYFPKKAIEDVSLCMPDIKGDFTLQMGDGDSFA